MAVHTSHGHLEISVTHTLDVQPLDIVVIIIFGAADYGSLKINSVDLYILTWKAFMLY